MDKVNYYHSQFDKQLSRYPILVQFEQKTGVPKAYAAIAVGFLGFLLLFFQLGANFITTSLGVFYPAYATMEAIENQNQTQTKQWLSYWPMFAMMVFAELRLRMIVSVVPLYFVLKAAFIVFLISPTYNGALKIYEMGLGTAYKHGKSNICALMNKSTKEIYTDAKSKASQAAKKMNEKAAESAESIKENISETVNNAKEKISASNS